MLESGELGRIKPSVAELQIRQRWRGAVLWVVRVLMIVFHDSLGDFEQGSTFLAACGIVTKSRTALPPAPAGTVASR